MKQKSNNTIALFKSPNGRFRGLYITPQIERIVLDNDIALSLESSPPDGPDETGSLAPEYLKNDPFKNQNV